MKPTEKSDNTNIRRPQLNVVKKNQEHEEAKRVGHKYINGETNKQTPKDIRTTSEKTAAKTRLKLLGVEQSTNNGEIRDTRKLKIARTLHHHLLNNPWLAPNGPTSYPHNPQDLESTSQAFTTGATNTASAILTAMGASAGLGNLARGIVGGVAGSEIAPLISDNKYASLYGGLIGGIIGGGYKPAIRFIEGRINPKTGLAYAMNDALETTPAVLKSLPNTEYVLPIETRTTTYIKPWKEAWEPTTRLYRVTGTSGKFKPSMDGTKEYAGMWFTDSPTKPNRYALETWKRSNRTGESNPLELQYVDIPNSQLERFRASSIADPKQIEFEPEDFIIPLDYPRLRIPYPVLLQKGMDQFKLLRTDLSEYTSYKPIKYNIATSVELKGRPQLYFEAVTDQEPGYVSVHFKTDGRGNQGSLTAQEKQALFTELDKIIPEGSKVSTYGFVSPGGVHGLNRLATENGYTQVGTRTVIAKETGEPLEIPIFEKPSERELLLLQIRDLNSLVQGKDAFKVFKTPLYKEAEKLIKQINESKYPIDLPLNWSSKNWFASRPKGLEPTAEEIAEFEANIPEYLEIQKNAGENWLKMPDGSIWQGDPREWVMMLSKAYKDFMQDSKFTTPMTHLMSDFRGNKVIEVPSTGAGRLWGNGFYGYINPTGKLDTSVSTTSSTYPIIAAEPQSTFVVNAKNPVTLSYKDLTPRALDLDARHSADRVGSFHNLSFEGSGPYLENDIGIVPKGKAIIGFPNDQGMAYPLLKFVTGNTGRFSKDLNSSLFRSILPFALGSSALYGITSNRKGGKLIQKSINNKQ